jgi:hypothetical protein
MPSTALSRLQELHGGYAEVFPPPVCFPGGAFSANEFVSGFQGIFFHPEVLRAQQQHFPPLSAFFTISLTIPEAPAQLQAPAGHVNCVHVLNCGSNPTSQTVDVRQMGNTGQASQRQASQTPANLFLVCSGFLVFCLV